MQKTGRRRWAMLALSLVLLIGIVLLVGKWLFPTTPSSVKRTSSNTIHCTSQHQEPHFGGTIVIDNNEVLCNDLTSFGGTLAINGVVQGNVVAFGGDIVVGGIVDGNINLYGGTVTLQSGSHIQGDINLYGGQWIRGSNAQVDGDIIDHTRHINGFLPGKGDFNFPLLPLLLWIALGLLITSLLPEHVMIVRTTIVNKTQRSLVIGLLSILLAPPVLVVLIALILPIPLAIIVALGLISAWALGTVALGWFIGEYIVRAIAPHRSTRPLQVVVGLTVLILAGSLPYIGWVISIGSGLLGLGSVFLSRFGTRLYSQPKHPLTL